MTTQIISKFVAPNGDEYIFSDSSKQNTVTTDTDSSDFSDATTIATGFGSDKIHLNVASRLWNYIKGKLGISSSGSSTKFLNEQGEWTTVTTPDVSGKADKVTGATAGDVATLDANGNLVDSGVTLDPSTNTIAANISGNASTADLATSTSSGSIPGGADLNSYNAANRNYLCNANDASTVTNKPSGASGAFELEVIRGTGSACVQVYYSRDNVNFNYIRKYTGSNTWTDWDRLSLASDASFSAVNKSENTSNGCTLTFTTIDGSTKTVTVKNVVKAGNADTVGGYHIVVGSTGTDSKTIYFT